MIVLRIKAGELTSVDWQVDRELFARRLRRGFYGQRLASGPPWPEDFTGIAIVDGHFPVGSALEFWADMARRSG